MTPERWQDVRAVFDELADLDPLRQSERLRACGAADPELGRAVEALLRADAQADARLAGVTLALAPPPDAPGDREPASDPLDLRGRTLAHFRIREPLGSGGMGVVYAAEDLRLQRPVALKLPWPERSLDSSAKRRFLHEARSAGALDHPNLCSIYEVGESEDGRLFMAMALYQGETLRARLARGPLSPDAAIDIARQIGQGLAAAHQAGVVHRDLKPGNVMLLPDGTVKILDFGLAKVRDLSLTGSGALLGTASYMAPEQVEGRPVDERTDLWALGIVLYEMLTGLQPFRGGHEISIAHAIVHQTPVRPSGLRDGIPPPVEEVVRRLLMKEPGDRYPMALEVVADLTAIQRGDPIRARTSPRAVRRAVLAGLAAVLLAGGAGAAYLGRRPEPARFERDLLVVAPFDVPDSALQLWREGLVDVLSMDLDGAGPLRTVPQSTVIRKWTGRADPASAAAVAARTGAELVVFGQLLRRSGDSIALRASVLDRSRGTIEPDLEVRGREDQMGTVADSLGLKILRRLGQSRPIGSVRRSSIGSRSLPALKEYLRGEQFFRLGLWDSAVVRYDRALVEDSTFALAFRQMGFTVGWRSAGFGPYASPGEYFRRAAALNHGLPPRDSLLLTADSLWLAAGAARTPDDLLVAPYRAMAILEDLARRYPDDAFIWYQLGELRKHMRPPLGGRADRALEAFDRAIALDPGFAPAYEHTVSLAFQLGREDRARAYTRAYTGLAPTRIGAPSVRLLALVLDSGFHAPIVREAVRSATVRTLGWVALEQLGGWVDSAETVVGLLREIVRGEHDLAGVLPDLGDSLIRRQRLAGELAFRGHLREATLVNQRLLSDEEASPLSPWGDPFHDLALLGALPDSLVGRTYQRALSPDARWDGGRHGDPPRWLRGLPWWLSRQDTLSLERLARRAAEVARISENPRAVVRARYAAGAAGAYLALARGDSAEALRRLEAISDSLCLMSPCFYEKLTLARVLAARGEDRRAAAILDQWSMAGELANTAGSVLAALERARIAERLADTATARERYRFVADAWRHADPELQPYVAEARAASTRLAS